MKLQHLVILVGYVALCASNAIPLVPRDNSHYVEGESQYIWMPDGDGLPHLVDLKYPVDEYLSRTRNGNNNQYWLFTRSNPTSAQVIVNGDANSITNSNYDASLPLKVIIHGWNSNGNTAVISQIRSSILSVMDANIIVMDWRNLASADYVSVMLSVPSIGQSCSNFIEWLFNVAGGSWDAVHLMGISLGAHVVGNAGRATQGRIGRITGLDPAGPLWIGNPNALRSADAQYVEGIHTDGGLLGIMVAVGHADFYPNGGRNPQLGCPDSNCSHGRAPLFFAASVSYNHLVGRQCSNIVQAIQNSCNGFNSLHMGNSILDKRGNGLFGLQTLSSWPY